MLKTTTGGFLAALMLCGIALTGNDAHALEVEDRERIRSPGQPAISPNGERIAFSEAGMIYIVSADGGEARALTSEATSAWSPVWSSDGDHLFFLSDRSGETQIWKLPIGGFGEASQVTNQENGVSSLNLSPAQDRVLLVLSDADLETAEAAEDAPAPPIVVRRRQFKRDSGIGYITPEMTTRIHVYDIETRELARITDTEFDDTSPAWSPDGESVVFVSSREEDADASYRNDLWIVPAAGGDTRALTNTDSAKYAPEFSPDGALVAYIDAGDDVFNVRHLDVVPVDGGSPRRLTGSLDRWVIDFAFSENGRWIYFTFYNAGAAHLARVRVSDGRIERLIEGEVLVGDFDVGSGSTLAVNMNRENDLADVHLLNGRRLSRLTDLNRDYLDDVDIGEKLKVSFPSEDGLTIEAFVTLPPDYEEGGRYPTILNIHGGPVWQFSWGYDFRAQYFAANGYVVIEPNTRGSTGHGQAFIDPIYQAWGPADYPDFIAAVDFAIEAGFSDPDRLAVTGYSYGGYMVNVIIAETDRFKGAAAGAGQSYITANFGHDMYQQWYVWELGVPWKDRENYDRLSPFLKADKVTTPTIFLGGRNDWNVTILNSEMMYQALKVLGIDAELVVYPDVHHGGWPSEYDQDYLRRVVGWFDRYVKGSIIDPE